jgi:hypothetical protein
MSASDLSFSAEPKLLDGSFNNNRTSTSFGGKAMFKGNDAINLHTSKLVQPAIAAKQPAAKLLDNWFNGNTTRVNVPRGKAADVRMMMPM